ncbi:MAG: teicoplanin resistance protein VanZ [Actinobacteria bacterium]|nr:MAG: teicoplanin resistance protein VanZ [Actinomycetota bacterium]
MSSSAVRHGSGARDVLAWFSWGATLGWMGVIFYLSSRTGIRVWSPLTYVAHFAEYFILTLLLCLALSLSTDAGRGRLLLMALLASSLYGVSDELHQAFVPTRDASVLDWVVDTAGAGTAVLLWRLGLTLRSSQVRVPSVYGHNRRSRQP